MEKFHFPFKYQHIVLYVNKLNRELNRLSVFVEVYPCTRSFIKPIAGAELLIYNFRPFYKLKIVQKHHLSFTKT